MRRLFLAGLLLLAGGCRQGDGIQRAAVGGTVTLDGVSVAEGSIAFYPCGDTRGPVAGGVIRDGAYHLNTRQGPAVGANRVEVHARKKTGRQIPSREIGIMMDEETEAIPGRYNTDSTLLAAIKPGNNVCRWELTSN